MPSLRDLQEQFAEALLGPGDAATALPIRANGLDPARRLRVYRNNVYASLSGALAACYPVVQRLIGEACFNHVSRRYVRAHPSRSGNLHDYGCHFAAFLSGEPAVRELPYLPDVARLEWLMQEVYHAAEPPAHDMTALCGIPPQRYGELRLQLHPAARLLTSAYPILRIWEVNQCGYAGDQTVSLDEGGVRLLIIRRDEDIEFEALGAGEYVLLSHLAAGDSAFDACEQALAAEPDFDLAVRLRSHIVRQTFTGFDLSAPSTEE